MQRHSGRFISVNARWLAMGVILAFTAVPKGLRAPVFSEITWTFEPVDVVSNILLYIPLGLATATAGLVGAGLIGAMLSGIVELLQLFSIGRLPGIDDVMANAAGATLGAFLARRTHSRFGAVTLRRQIGAILLIAVCALFALGWRGTRLSATLHDGGAVNVWSQMYIGSAGMTTVDRICLLVTQYAVSIGLPGSMVLAGGLAAAGVLALVQPVDSTLLCFVAITAGIIAGLVVLVTSGPAMGHRYGWWIGSIGALGGSLFLAGVHLDDARKISLPKD